MQPALQDWANEKNVEKDNGIIIKYRSYIKFFKSRHTAAMKKTSYPEPAPGTLRVFSATASARKESERRADMDLGGYEPDAKPLRDPPIDNERAADLTRCILEHRAKDLEQIQVECNSPRRDVALRARLIVQLNCLVKNLSFSHCNGFTMSGGLKGPQGVTVLRPANMFECATLLSHWMFASGVTHIAISVEDEQIGVDEEAYEVKVRLGPPSVTQLYGFSLDLDYHGKVSKPQPCWPFTVATRKRYDDEQAAKEAAAAALCAPGSQAEFVFE